MSLFWTARSMPPQNFFYTIKSKVDMSDQIKVNLLILVCYLIYNAIRRRINPQYGLDKKNFSGYEFSIGFIAILALHILIFLVFVKISPVNIVSINLKTGLIDLILLIIYMESLEYLLRKNRARWFLNKKSN